jgi:DNA repair protein RecN (Recombination protein N)
LLHELTIANFAIIERLSLTLLPGFNVFSGETGAGKSILIDAVSALLGSRVGADYVRAGTDHARVEGVFLIPTDNEEKAANCGRLRLLLDEYGLNEGEETLILSREIGASGRSVSRVNGKAVPVAVLQQVAALLVDIHGQGEHLSLLRVAEHVNLLDDYAGVRELRSQLAGEVAQLRQIRRELSDLVRDERELARRTDLLRFQIGEITSAALVPGEEETLEADKRVLSNAEALTSSANGAYEFLYEGRDEQRSVTDLLGEVCFKLGEMARLDASLEQELITAESGLAQIEDLAHSLRAYRDRIEYDPARLAEIDERIELIRTLKRKYGNSIDEILRFSEQAAAELESLAHGEERLAELQAEESRLLERIGSLAEKLSEIRSRAGGDLARDVEGELTDLNMPKARFAVSMGHNQASDGVLFSDGKRYAFDATGVDKVEFLVSPNPGEPLKPLAKIASGGETARLMLALKGILASADPVATLIFDEIDQGIGGRSGQVVGKKLWRLARGHQVICVTHLPQIACFADAHFTVAKRVVDERTLTSVSPLIGDQCVDEIVAMLGSVSGSSVARSNVTEMLAEARSWKEQLVAS